MDLAKRIKELKKDKSKWRKLLKEDKYPQARIEINAKIIEIAGAIKECEHWQKLDASENSLHIQSVSNNEVAVCPKCASEDVIWTCYCNRCNEVM